MYYKDLRAFSLVDGAGFKALASQIYNLALRSKRACEIDDLLPSANPAKNYVVDNRGIIREKLHLLYTAHFTARNGAGFTTDLWTDSTKCRTFMSITIN